MNDLLQRIKGNPLLIIIILAAIYFLIIQPRGGLSAITRNISVPSVSGAGGTNSFRLPTSQRAVSSYQNYGRSSTGPWGSRNYIAGGCKHTGVNRWYRVGDVTPAGFRCTSSGWRR